MEKDNLIENKYVKIWMEDDIMHCLFKAHSLTLDAAKKCVKTRISVSEGKHHLICIDMQNVHDVAKPARDYLATTYGQRYVKAGAILTTSDLTKMIGNFFLDISKPTRPTRIFTEKEKAILWLKKVEKNPEKYKLPVQQHDIGITAEERKERKKEKNFWDAIVDLCSGKKS